MSFAWCSYNLIQHTHIKWTAVLPWRVCKAVASPNAAAAGLGILLH